MKKGDRVNANFGPKGTEQKGWKRAGIDEGTIGVVVRVIDSNVHVEWNNNCFTVSPADCLKPYEEGDIPLPNRKFTRRAAL